MPFPSDLTAPQEATLRTSGYWSRNLVCLNQDEPIFVARSAQAISTVSFIQFLYDTVTVGAIADVYEGFIVYLSATSSIRDAYYRGRVRLAPNDTTFFIDLNAEILSVDDFVIVVRDFDIFARIRSVDLVDGSIAYHATPDVLQGLPNTIVLYDADNDDSVSYTTVQVPVHVDVLSTSTSTWLWEISGDGTSSISNAAIQNPTITFEAGYHYVVRVTHTNNLTISNYQMMHVYAVTRTFTAPVVQGVIAGSISGNFDDGWTASLTAYADVSTLIDRTHAVVWHIEHMGDDSSTPIFDNVLMCGRIRSDTIQTEGSAEAGQLQQVTFAVEGITSYMRRLRIPNDIIRAVSAPNEWGEMTAPNPYRMAVYMAWAYTTLTNIGSFGVESGAFADWQIGGEPRGIDGGFTLDVINGILDPIKAAMNYAPSGELFLAINTNYRADRTGVELIATLGLGDMRTYSVDRDSSRTIAQVIAFGGVYDSTANVWILYTAQAPSIVYGDASETDELTREILIVDSTIEDASIELGLRASNHYAFRNPKPLLKITIFDSWAGVFIPTNYQRWAAVIPASSNTLNIAYSASDYWQLQAVSLTLNSDGTIDVSVDMPAETSFDDAQIMASLLPINLTDMNPVLPVLPNDPAFPTDPLENYPNDFPALEDLQPIDGDTAAQSQTPWPPDQAAQVGAKQGKAGCQTVAVNLRVATNTTSTRVLALGTDYLLEISGTGSVGTSPAASVLYNFLVGTGGFIPYVNGAALAYAQYFAGQGFGQNPSNLGAIIIKLDLNPQLITDIVLDFSEDLGNYGPTVINIRDYAANPAQGGILVTSVMSQQSYTFSGLSTTDGLEIEVYTTIAAPLLRLERVTLTGSVIPPEPRNVDAFYSFDLSDEGKPSNWQLLGGTEGLFIENVKFPAPDHNDSHRYSNIIFPGTNNVLSARMEFPDYSQNSNTNIYIDACPKVEP